MSLKRFCFLVLLLLLVSVQLVAAQDSFEEQGTIDANNPEATFELELAEGDVVMLTVEALNGDLDPKVGLVNEDGDLVAENDDIDTDGGNYNSQLSYEADTDGVYLIVVTAFGDTTGDFLLTIEFGEFTGGGDGEELDSDNEDSGRPDLEQTFDTEHFVIHYDESGENASDGDYIDLVAEVVEETWQIEIEEMGWPAPPSDQGAGGDERFDLYVMELCNDDEAYGYAEPEGEEGDNPNSPDEEIKGGSSFLVIDNNFDDDCFENGESDLRATVAHEFHHNIQFGYDVEDTHNWYYEATATWMETQVSGDDQQATMYVADVFETPEACFGNDDAAYGTYLFIQTLVDEHGDDIVMELWQNIAQVEGFEALEITLDAYGDDIPTAVSRFALNNLVRAYPYAEEFGVTSYLENTIDDVGDWSYTGDGIQELGASYFAVDLESANYSAYLNGDDSSDMSLYAIGIYDGGADVYLLDNNSVFSTDYDYTYLMVFNTAYDDDPLDCDFYDYSITVEETDDDTADVEMTLDVSNFEPLGE